MDWRDLRIFCVAADAPTLTEAARRLGTSVATVSRRLGALEGATGLTLFDRSPDGVTLTRQGRLLRERADRVADAVGDLGRLAAALKAGGWTDPVRVSATEPFVAEVLAPALPDLLDRHPDIDVHLLVSSEVVSLAAREADVAVRFARPVGQSLVARRLPGIGFGLYLSRGRLGDRRPEALDPAAEPFVGYDLTFGNIPERRWIEGLGDRPRVRVAVGSTRAMVAAVRAGVGLGILPRLLADPDPELVEVPAPRPIPDRPVHLVVHRELARTPPVRAVMDWVARAWRDARLRAAAGRATAGRATGG